MRSERIWASPNSRPSLSKYARVPSNVRFWRKLRPLSNDSLRDAFSIVAISASHAMYDAAPSRTYTPSGRIPLSAR